MVRYLNMGLGIENRARTLAPFWAEHLNRTRTAQARWAQRASGEWLTVLGAGRLLDFNRLALLPRFAKLRLVDADPVCQALWKGVPKLYEAVCLDITGCLDQWMRTLRGTGKPWQQTLQIIRNQRAPVEVAYSQQGDALLSLNILSQLQIVWQEAVEDYLERRFGKKLVERNEAEWLEALRPGGQALVVQHFAAVERSKAAYVLLITDLEYLEYQGVVFQQEHWAPPPVEWTAAGGWKAEVDLVWQRSPALEGVELTEETFARWLPSYRLVWQESWLWHIAPQGTENTPYGTVHRVGAFALEAVLP